ncbi:hypothetical protein [Pseudomonas sp. UMAB-40]|uniref:hypothetical protein n=1 Tax=Pseudomonas sp. UMAB-40 TaxID=1365407 RepID=UPI001C59470D|nr:hypothetical protein [Pseudomonas sp. UMAB-40]
MQQAECKAVMVNDIGLLNADQVPAFRAFLEKSGLQVRDSGAGQFFHFRLPDVRRWLPVERGRAGAPVTPDVLREYICQFNKKPLHAAMGAFRPPVAGAIATPANSEPAGSASPALEPIRLVEPAVLSMAPLGARLEFKQPAPLSRYLSDLRDDLALHCPLVQQHNESVRSFAIRRWEYADVMLSTRSAQSGD